MGKHRDIEEAGGLWSWRFRRLGRNPRAKEVNRFLWLTSSPDPKSTASHLRGLKDKLNSPHRHFGTLEFIRLTYLFIPGLILYLIYMRFHVLYQSPCSRVIQKQCLVEQNPSIDYIYYVFGIECESRYISKPIAHQRPKARYFYLIPQSRCMVT